MMPVACSPSRRVRILDTEWKQFTRNAPGVEVFAQQRVIGWSEQPGESGETGESGEERRGGLMAHHAHDSIIR